MKVLLVEDEPVLADEIVGYFSSQGFLVEHADTYATAAEKIDNYTYDVVILDITLPGGSGIELIPGILKQNVETGIIVLSAKNSLHDKLQGLNRGADDYLTKPFYLEELSARLYALFRRKMLKGTGNIRFDNFTIDPQSKVLLFNDEEIMLTKKEYQLLLYFIVNRNRVVSKPAIAEHIWGDHVDQSNNFDAVYVHLTNLRKKLNNAANKDYIKTLYGMGYKFTA
ncbi:response regulator transcription factor [Mucilaginibacter gynuensis]|uniref:Response regulator transcription factor n=1 Tax=Mucilaginibacter gynuensis TaxID=1302236 RepID=A0ABP8G9U9_9SPHI